MDVLTLDSCSHLTKVKLREESPNTSRVKTAEK